MTAAAYRLTKEIQGGCLAKETRILTKGVLTRMHDNAGHHSAAATVSLLTSWGCEILPYPPHSPDLHLRNSFSSQGRKSTSEVNTSTPLTMFKIKSKQTW